MNKHLTKENILVVIVVIGVLVTSSYILNLAQSNHPQPQTNFGIFIKDINYQVISQNKSVTGYDIGKITNISLVDGVIDVVTLESGKSFSLEQNDGVPMDMSSIGQIVKITHHEYDSSDCIISNMVLYNGTKISGNQDKFYAILKDPTKYGVVWGYMVNPDINGNVKGGISYGHPTFVNNYVCNLGKYDEVSYR